MTVAKGTNSTPIWWPQKRPAGDRSEGEVLASIENHADGLCIAIVENFGYGWYANAMPPRGEGTSSMVPGMIRGGNFGERAEAAKAWCERTCGLHPEIPGDRRAEGVEAENPH